MGQYKNILVAIDISNEAEQVLTKAAALAEQNQAQLSIIYVLETPAQAYAEWANYTPAIDSAAFNQSILESAHAIVERCGIDKDLLTMDFGIAADCIVKNATTQKADLIIVGSHGRHGIRLLLGSTANSVLHHAECDVLALRIKEAS